MLRSMVSQATGGTSAELEAITAERDFFREKYAEQIDAMEEMKTKLKESQRVIDRLRSQVLDLELEKSKRTSSGRQQQQQQTESPGSTNTSVTALTCDDDATTKSGVENVVESTVERASGGSAEEENSPSTEGGPAEVSQDVDEDEQSIPDDSDEDEEDSDEEEESEAESEDDEAAKVRAQAERMLLWANYQTSKRPTPNTSLIQDDDDDESKADSETRPEGGVSGEIVYDLPTSLDKRRSSLLDDDDDDESTLGSSSRHHAEPSVSSNSRAGSAGGKIGTLFNKLQDMIDPQSESDSDGESFASES